VRFAVIVGDPQPASPALAVATAAADALSRRIGLADRRLGLADSRTGLADSYEVIDLSTLSRRLLLPEPSAAVEDAVSVTLGAELLLVVSPVAAGTYSGLLKVFLDRLPGRALAGARALPLLVMSTPVHARAVDAYLRPVLIELGATTPVPGLAVLQADRARLDSVVESWARQVTAALGMAVAAQSA
jgi:FMN reductase